MKHSINILCFLIFINYFKCISSIFTPVLKINQGRIRGLYHVSGQYRYYSIPYAISERFQTPKEPPTWQGTFNAFTQYRSCAQRAEITMGEEDCLELDIATPILTPMDEKLPVIVIFPGGAFYFGSKTNYDPEYLVAKGVVAVTVNYRLGVLGFLCANGVANLGLKDQTAAMKWVQKNIAAFGGDPGRVTILGISSSAVCAGMHLFSEASKGLFHRAVLMSADFLAPWAINLDPLKYAFEDASKMAKVKTEADIYNVFAKASLDDLMRATEAKINPRQMKYCPCIDSNYTDPFFRDTPYNILKSGKFSKVPVMMGVANVEGKLFYLLASKPKQMVKTFIDMLPSTFSGCSKRDRMNITMNFRRHYFKGKLSHRRLVKGLVDYYSDWICYSSFDAAAKLLARHSDQPVYNYLFEYEGTRNFGSQLVDGLTKMPGTTHTDDIFYMIKVNGITWPLFLPDDDKIFIERFNTMLANFIRFGNPTPNTSKLLPIYWPATTANETKVMRLDRELSVTPLPQELRGDFFRSQQCKYGLQGYVPCESEMACNVD